MKIKSQSIISAFVIIYCSVMSVYAGEVKGNLTYTNQYTGPFKAHLKASGLRPERKYVPCLNGYTNHPSNEILIKLDKKQESTGQGYVDLEEVTSDKSGSLDVDIELKLPPAEYKIKFLLKDSEDPAWLVVFHKDNMRFEVIESAQSTDKK
jgi:hypothetical protein